MAARRTFYGRGFRRRLAGKVRAVKMEPIRNGNREFVPLDRLHLENLHATLPEFGLPAAHFDDRELGDLNAAWQRLDPWEDSVAGLSELGHTWSSDRCRTPTSPCCCGWRSGRNCPGP